jgi:WD40 repeat protein
LAFLRYKPTQNDQVAVGLENGEVQIWDLLNQKNEPLLRLGQQRDDRVLDVRFTPDARSLFSAHGSGRIFRWDLSTQSAGLQEKPSQTLQLEFAIYSTSLIGDGNTLAIGGKFNRLELWNWQTQKRRSIPYLKSGGQYDYIQTLATSEYQPYLMASGDTQGTIALWDMKACTTDPTQPCRMLDQWTEGHGGSPIQSVALSRNGCFLVSGGGDSQVKLWALTAEGRRSIALRDGIKVDESFSKKEAIQSVDLKVIQDSITIISGSEDSQVRGTTIPKPKQLGCDRE